MSEKQTVLLIVLQWPGSAFKKLLIEVYNYMLSHWGSSWVCLMSPYLDLVTLRAV